jgi:ferritin-like metal-binding protein YciE
MAVFAHEFNSLDELFVHELKDLYDAEHRLTDALPKMAEAASSSDLKQAFTTHLRETQGHIQRLEQVFQLINHEPERSACKAMKGILDEGSDMLSAKGDDKVRDAALIASAQRAEHYEIAGYGTARTFANHLGRTDLAQLLQSILDEEGETDKKLTRIAESHINVEATH